MTDKERIAQLEKAIEDALDWLSDVDTSETSSAARAKETLHAAQRAAPPNGAAEVQRIEEKKKT